ncbi:flagellar hook-basal body complex protein FliE [Brevibacillus sp. SYSU BS000544]|uniref:flagellar hook-basal body complex protein FliE n=1 Tax=Brevibacillus sp. SYSU BS000544 TaxID=3416443 RepID=UPI003CE4DDC6
MQINSIRPLGFQPEIQSPAKTPADVTKSFGSYLSDAIEEVNAAQIESSKLTEKFATGQVEDIHQVMIASQKSSIALSLTMQVRNKVIESYQEIMRMPI